MLHCGAAPRAFFRSLPRVTFLHVLAWVMIACKNYFRFVATRSGMILLHCACIVFVFKNSYSMILRSPVKKVRCLIP
jgi:hypothetical protein